MTKQTDPLARPTKAQNVFAISLVATVLVAIVVAAWYVRRPDRGGAPSSPAVETGRGSSLDSIQIGDFTAQIKGEFRMPSSQVEIEFKNSQGQLTDVGQVRLALDMPMPGMLMHDDATVSGSGGRYRARIKHQMAGSWTAKLSISGPQGSAERTFPVNVKGGG